MIWLLYAGLCPAFLMIVLIVLKEIASYINLRHYANQGIETHYIPFFGIQWRIRSEDHQSDPLALHKEFYKETKKMNNEKGVIAFNSLFSIYPVLLLTTKESTSELYKLEVSNFKRRKILDNGIKSKNAFFFQGGIKGLKKRTIYADFFNYQNILKMMKPNLQIIHSRISKFKNEIESTSKDCWVEVDIAPVIHETLDDLLYELLFGGHDSVTIPLIDGIILTEYIAMFVKNTAKVVNNPLYWLTFGMVHKLQLMKISREVFSMKKKIVKVLLIIYNQRRKQGSLNKINIIDIMIEGNQRVIDQGVEEDILSSDDIVEDLISFYVAAMDTVESSMRSSLYILSTKPELSNLLWNELYFDILKGDIRSLHGDGELDLESLPLLTMFVKELLRRFGPTHYLIYRTATSNLKLNGINVKKGTDALILYNGLHHDREIFPDPFSFDINRWSTEGSKRIPNWMYAPFTLGKRSCMGKQLGESNLKGLILNLLAVFEFKEATNSNPTWSSTFELRMDSTVVQLRKRIL